MRILEQRKAEQDSSDDDGPPKFENLSKAEQAKIIRQQLNRDQENIEDLIGGKIKSNKTKGVRKSQ